MTDHGFSRRETYRILDSERTEYYVSVVTITEFFRKRILISVRFDAWFFRFS